MLEILKLFEYFILTILLGLSIWSVSVMIDRRRVLKKLASSNLASTYKKAIAESGVSGLKTALSGKSSDEGYWTGFGRALIQTVEKSRSIESLDRVTRSYMTDQKIVLEKGLTVLATLGSNAPFIGLLGTVLGIIAAFASLSGGDPGASNTVMTGISRALIATAAGLFVAIPAVVAYNYFQREVKKIFMESESMKDLLAAQLTSSERS